MNKQQLYDYYYNLMSKEYREEIEGYEEFKMEGVQCAIKGAIKVIFKNGDWIRVYQKVNGEVEWY